MSNGSPRELVIHPPGTLDQTSEFEDLLADPGLRATDLLHTKGHALASVPGGVAAIQHSRRHPLWSHQVPGTEPDVDVTPERVAVMVTYPVPARRGRESCRGVLDVDTGEQPDDFLSPDTSVAVGLGYANTRVLVEGTVQGQGRKSGGSGRSIRAPGAPTPSLRSVISARPQTTTTRTCRSSATAPAKPTWPRSPATASSGS